MALRAARARADSSFRLRGLSRPMAGYVSGQVPMVNGELVTGSITVQSQQAIRNLLTILNEAGYGPQDVVRCSVWLEDPRDFSAFNAVFKEHFGAYPPARACVVSSMVVDCKVEIECVAYKAPTA